MHEALTISKLFVLGVLAQGEKHGYDLVTTAEKWAIHRWAGVSIGSIYSTLRRFDKQQIIEPVRTEQAENRPNRIIYRLSKEGQQIALNMIEEGLGSLQFESRELDMALAFAHLIPPETRKQKLLDRLPMLNERKQQLQWLNDSYASSLNSDDPALAEFRELRISNPWIYAGIRHGLARIRVEESWTNELIQEIDNWAYRPMTTNVNL